MNGTQLLSAPTCRTAGSSLGERSRDSPLYHIAWVRIAPPPPSSLEELLHASGASPDDVARARTWSWRGLLQSYVIDRHRHADFFWVAVSRTFYYMGISVNAFLQYYFRDLVVTSPVRASISHPRGPPPSPVLLGGMIPQEEAAASDGVLADPARAAAIMAFIGQSTGMLSAFPAGLLSDYSGRKPLVVRAQEPSHHPGSPPLLSCEPRRPRMRCMFFCTYAHP